MPYSGRNASRRRCSCLFSTLLCLLIDIIVELLVVFKSMMILHVSVEVPLAGNAGGVALRASAFKDTSLVEPLVVTGVDDVMLSLVVANVLDVGSDSRATDVAVSCFCRSADEAWLVSFVFNSHVTGNDVKGKRALRDGEALVLGLELPSGYLDETAVGMVGSRGKSRR
ncbi:hypothetical protein F5Y16DRAFT_419103 [Xylariaceae sp. FL0255]|nr:hypothetical protein F5Y16DRAFT_419103 [Xylariaceae sp. FL0255]